MEEILRRDFTKASFLLALEAALAGCRVVPRRPFISSTLEITSEEELLQVLHERYGYDLILSDFNCITKNLLTPKDIY